MKELSIEEKAKRYDEAIKRAKGAHNGAKSDKENGVIDRITEYTIQLTETIFPELRESEDEINKDIIAYMRYERKSSKEEIENRFIPWLEKQDPKKFEEELEKAYKYADKVQYMKGYEDAKCEIEKQGEQKSKIEYNLTPKTLFKKGDWIVNKQNEIARVNEVKKDSYGTQKYYIEFIDGTKTNIFSCFAYKDGFQLWTIEDAKDGDVLAIGNEYFLFREKKENTSPAIYISHCFVDSAGAFRVTNGRDCGEFLSIENGVKACPATKEQRDFLFSKMKEAGYEWDAEQKQLKKIEQEPDNLSKGEDYGIDGLWHAKTILEKTLGKVEGYQSDDGILEHKRAINVVKNLYERNYAWSKEDITNYSKVLFCLQTLTFPIDDERKELITWLKKQCEQNSADSYCQENCKGFQETGKCYADGECKAKRDAEQNPAWSEEDENKCMWIVRLIGTARFSEIESDRIPCDRNELIKWLKSLKPQPQWKPTKEQMENLEYAINMVDKCCENSLQSLYNNLKKL